MVSCVSLWVLALIALMTIGVEQIFICSWWFLIFSFIKCLFSFLIFKGVVSLLIVESLRILHILWIKFHVNFVNIPQSDLPFQSINTLLNSYSFCFLEGLIN